MYRSALVGVCLIFACGCGTVVNLSRFSDKQCGTVAYGGVDWDLEKATEKHDAALKNPPRRNFESVDGNQSALLLLDVPFSFVGDTLTLPIAWYAERNREYERKKEAQREQFKQFWSADQQPYDVLTKDQ